MKTKTIVMRTSVVAALAVAVAMTTDTSHAADASATALATIVVPIAVSQTAAMTFGSLAPTASASTVVLDTGGALTPTNVDVMDESSAADAFSVTGSGTSSYTVTQPTSVTLSDGANNMTLNGFGHSAGATPQLSGGSDSFNVGATLAVGANQATGTYSGNYTVTVNY